VLHFELSNATKPNPVTTCYSANVGKVMFDVGEKRGRLHTLQINLLLGSWFAADTFDPLV
jgi:hypothetical protein